MDAAPGVSEFHALRYVFSTVPRFGYCPFSIALKVPSLMDFTSHFPRVAVWILSEASIPFTIFLIAFILVHNWYGLVWGGVRQTVPWRLLCASFFNC